MELEPLIVLLRSHGVARYEADGISVSFHEPTLQEREIGRTAAALGVTGPGAASAADEEQCTCGHSIMTEHTPTGCAHGCPIDTCGRQGPPGDDA